RLRLQLKPSLLGHLGPEHDERSHGQAPIEQRETTKILINDTMTVAAAPNGHNDEALSVRRQAPPKPADSLGRCRRPNVSRVGYLVSDRVWELVLAADVKHST